MASSDHQYINRIFSLLDCFSVENPDLGVREAARMLNISPSSCGRLLGELRDEGILIQNTESRTYSLGGRVIRWAEVYSESSDLRKKAFPFMEDIYRQTNETVTLYTAEEFDRVCVERIESRKTVRVSEPIGTRINIFTGSGGKSILAFRTEEEIEHVFEYARTLPKYEKENDYFDQLQNEFQIIRKQGFAISHGEWQTDASGIGAPIFNDRGIPIGSISISAPTQRFLNEEILRSYSKILVQNVKRISRELGYIPERR
ncbi:MAG: IclR family transcriptional regulator [Flexilinea sp.]|nr:IclR family transcriptional regulator [Flexilinea sp.]